MALGFIARVEGQEGGMLMAIHVEMHEGEAAREEASITAEVEAVNGRAHTQTKRPTASQYLRTRLEHMSIRPS